jgi:hypothetical protein
MANDPRQSKYALTGLGASVGGLNEAQIAQIDQYMSRISDLNSFEFTKDGYITLGLVVAVVPFSNIYLVSLAGTGNEKKVALAIYQGSNRINGVKSVTYLLPGTYVSVFIRGTETDVSLPAFTILGTIEPLIGLETGDGKGGPVHHIFDTPSEFLAHSGTAAGPSLENTIIKTVCQNPIEMSNFNYGKPMDALAGEHVTSNVFGGGLLVTDFMAILKGSEASRIECYMFDDTIRITANQLLVQNGLYDEKMFFNQYGISRMKCMAMTLAEGLGSLDGTPRLANKITADNAEEARVHTLENGRIGYFNYNIIDGNLGDGSYEYITYPPKGVTYKGDSVIPPGLLSVEKTYDGSFRVKAAREISLQKTMYIVAPKELKPSNANSREEGIGMREDWDKNHESVENLSFLGKQFTGTWEEFQREHSLDDMVIQKDFWMIPSKADVYKAFNDATGATFEAEDTLEPLPADQPHYITPAKKVAIKPFTTLGDRDEPFNVYNTSSGIRQLPDGSVIIYGGNGEEIRMYKGNIYITCPGDIIYQAGRDIVSMAPRHNIIKAGKGSLELTSNNGLSVVSQGNLQICAGSSGEKGTLVIENKSPLDMDLTVFDEGVGLNNLEASGGGIMVKSETRTSILGKNTYMGAGNNFGGSSAEIDAYDTEFHSDYHKHYVTSMASILNRGGSALTLGQGNIELLASNMTTVGGAVAITSTFETMDYLDRNGDTSSLSLVSSSSQLQVNGALVANGSISADAVGTPNGGQLGKLEGLSWANAVRSIPKEANFNTRLNVPSYLGLGETLKKNDQALADLDLISTVMPSVAAYKTANFYFPFSTWQSILTGDSTWSEKGITGSFATMAFPGLERWDEAGSLKGFKDEEIEDKTLGSDYKINC